MQNQDELPIEISESSTDLGFPLYEWVYAGHGWAPFDLWMSFYTSQRPFGHRMDQADMNYVRAVQQSVSTEGKP